ncbi:MAG: TCP-1/cpn60 chaperonin family protein [Candidatus Aenigmarchaeota archaeon]|nr:TCP-1/cpn60 chaperonin family protein [Candidatus Aenigmarchaeota archaeon]
MLGQTGAQPIFILPEGTLRQIGKDAQKTNIAAAKAVADSVRTTLGPKGMDKMLVDTIGDVVITNDGATILDEMEIDHPAAKMMVEVAKTQEDEVGDGTTTAVVLAGELLEKAGELIDQGIHPSIIIRGYRIAKTKSLEVLDKLAKTVTVDSPELEKIAMTAMTGKGSEAAKESLAKLAVKAVKSIIEDDEIDTDNIKIEKRRGGSIDDTELIEGLVIDKEVVHAAMPKTVRDAKIALIDSALEIKETETDAQIRITNPEQLKGFIEQENAMLKEMVDKIVKSGCNVVFCQKGIDDLAQHYLAKNKIMAVRRVKKSDMKTLAKATGASIITNLDELTEDELGYAGIVEEKKVAGEEIIFVRKCKNPKAVSILIRGGTEHVVDEAKRAMEDAILGVAAAIKSGKIVTGGGSTEVEIAKKLREFSETVGGREQLAINAFADAMEVIPKTLASSSGMDTIDTLVELRSLHEKGKTSYGVGVLKGKCIDMEEEGVVEPVKIKTQAIKSASEAAEMILRIDDVITASKVGSESSKSPGAGQGMPPGMM